MSEFLWTCGSGREFVTTVSGYRFVVRRAGVEPGYEFQVERSADAEPAVVASGCRANLRDAFEAAEQTLAGLLEGRNARPKLMLV